MPQSSNQAGSTVNLSCPVNSGTGVSCYIYSWNNTGLWINQTATRFTNYINSTAAYAIFSGTLNTVAGNAVSVIIYANNTIGSWSASPQYNFVIAPGPSSKLSFTTGAAQSLTAGQLSSVVTVQRQDQYENPVTSGSTTVSLKSTSGRAIFYSDAGITRVTSVVIKDGSSTVNFWYKAASPGSPTLTVSAPTLTSASTKFKINR